MVQHDEPSLFIMRAGTTPRRCSRSRTLSGGVVPPPATAAAAELFFPGGATPTTAAAEFRMNHRDAS